MNSLIAELARPPRAAATRKTAIVLGSDELGSAVAHALQTGGFSVVLVDDADPPWSHRGRAFTDAWFTGTADLDGQFACFCASVRSVPSILNQRIIAATTWSWAGLAASLHSAVIVDATLGVVGQVPRQLLGKAPLTIGVGARFTAGSTADLVIAVDAGLGSPSGDLRSGQQLDNCVYSPSVGRFVTTHKIGEQIQAGDVVGSLGTHPIIAPCRGVLSGLSARGASVRSGQELVDVDLRQNSAHCFGISHAMRQIAADVLAEVQTRAT